MKEIHEIIKSLQNQIKKNGKCEINEDTLNLFADAVDFDEETLDVEGASELLGEQPDMIEIMTENELLPHEKSFHPEKGEVIKYNREEVMRAYNELHFKQTSK